MVEGELKTCMADVCSDSYIERVRPLQELRKYPAVLAVDETEAGVGATSFATRCAWPYRH
jgi:hypothetical protein